MPGHEWSGGSCLFGGKGHGFGFGGLLLRYGGTGRSYLLHGGGLGLGSGALLLAEWRISPFVPASKQKPRFGVRGFASLVRRERLFVHVLGTAGLTGRTCFEAKAPVLGPGLCFFGTAGQAVRTCTWYGGSHRSYLLQSKSPGWMAGALLVRYSGSHRSQLFHSKSPGY